MSAAATRSSGFVLRTLSVYLDSRSRARPARRRLRDRWCRLRIARGTGRIALVGHRWTVKLPYPRSTGHPYRGRMWAAAWGLLANISEHEHSTAAGVNPVRWSLLGGLVNVYRTARPLTCDPARWPDTSPDVATDRHHTNVGWVDGQLRWLDYDSSGEDVLGFRSSDARSG